MSIRLPPNQPLALSDADTNHPRNKKGQVVKFSQRHLPLYRQIIDLSDFASSVWTAAPGQSGIPYNAHYDDRIDQWRDGSYSPVLYSRERIDEQAVSRLELRP
jgi:penicillin G amidase